MSSFESELFKDLQDLLRASANVIWKEQKYTLEKYTLEGKRVFLENYVFSGNLRQLAA